MGALASIRGISTATILGVCAFLLVGLFSHPSFTEENAANVITVLGLRESVVAARDMKGWEKRHSANRFCFDHRRISSDGARRWGCNRERAMETNHSITLELPVSNRRCELSRRS